jgi:hypothetical protein
LISHHSRNDNSICFDIICFVDLFIMGYQSAGLFSHRSEASPLSEIHAAVPTVFEERGRNRDVTLSVFFDSCLSSETTIISRPATVCYQPTLIRLYQNGSVIRGLPVASQDID